MAHEALKALASIGITFRTDDFKSKEAAEQASTHLKALQKIFLETKDPMTSTIPTQPRPASRPPSPQPTTSGVTTIRPSPVRSVPAENESLEVMDFINVTLNYEAESDADGDADGNAADGDAADGDADAADGDACVRTLCMLWRFRKFLAHPLDAVKIYTFSLPRGGGSSASGTW